MFYEDKFKKYVLLKRNNYIIGLVVLFVALAVFNTLMFIYLNRNNALTMQIIITIIDTLGIIGFLYILLNPLMREVHYLHHIKLIEKQTKDESTVKVVEILEEKITTKNDIVCYELIVEENEVQRSIYLLKDFDIKLFEVGKEYKLTLCSSYIVGVNYEGK